MKFKEFIDSFGIFSPIVYILMVVLQILVPIIPGEPLEMVAGYAFGTVKGTILCLLSESIASILVVLLVRKYGRKFVNYFFEKSQIDKLKFLKNNKSRTLLFAIIFIMPGTPKDLLCYVAGLLKIKLSYLLMIVTIGRIPSVITSTLMGSHLSDKRYEIAIIVFIITCVLSSIGVLLYRYFSNRKED
ncbi:MAG: VTT domain-containing protein [Erysipelotrichaceae bacterium]|nr:VTT domain-containing protein [Erysipelotrichaceae bacterium]